MQQMKDLLRGFKNETDGLRLLIAGPARSLRNKKASVSSGGLVSLIEEIKLPDAIIHTLQFNHVPIIRI